MSSPADDFRQFDQDQSAARRPAKHKPNREVAMDALQDRTLADGGAAADAAGRFWEPWLSMWRANALVLVDPWDNVMRAFTERAQLLPRRLAVLDLDADKLACGKPSTVRELVERCTTCESPEQCAWDLREDPANPAWQSYCPNAARLMALAKETSLQGTPTT
jgi:Family of unknown function (DUF6455)